MINILARSVEIDGRAVLMIDSRLDAKSFAQARLAQLINETGFLVHSDGQITPWRLDGTFEADGGVAFYGPNFIARPLLDRLLNDPPAEALDALRRWAAARQTLIGQLTNPPAPIPAAALLNDEGDCLFLPERLARRALEAHEKALSLEVWRRWNHPDLYGPEADNFTLGALCFRLFGGLPPFNGTNETEVYAEMRYAPRPSIRFFAPDLAEPIAALIDSSLKLTSQRTVPKPRAIRSLIAAQPRQRLVTAPADHSSPATPLLSFTALAKALGPVGSGGPDSFKTTINPASAQQIAKDRSLYTRQKKINRLKRFFDKHNIAITIVAVVIIGSGLAIRGIRQNIANQPTTAGLEPQQVVENYYQAFNSLDHQLMEASTIKPTGKGDIESTVNIFVIVKMRLAYESRDVHLAPETWLVQGEETDLPLVYGISDLSIRVLEADESDGRTSFLVDYRFWRPGDNQSAISEPDTRQPINELGPPPPIAEARQDRVYVSKIKDQWRISQIDRQVLD